MSSADNGNVIDATRSLGERAARLAREAGDWLSSNSADIALSLLAAAFIALLLIGVRGLGRRQVRNRSEDVQWRTIFARVLAKTSLFFIIMCAVQLVVGQTDAPRAIRRASEVLFIVAAALQAAIWGRELILGFVYQRVGEAEEHSTLGSAIGIIRLLVTIALFAIALILILANIGVNVTGLVAGLGIGGIAIGLAAQGIFSDLFAALSIIFDRPFRKGDAIRVGQVQGHVENIGLKSTRIRSLDGEQVAISNAKLLAEQIHNFSNLERRRFVARFGLVYQLGPDRLRQVPDMVRREIEARERTRFVRCGLVAFGASSLDFEAVFEIDGVDFEQTFAIRHDLLLGILEAFAQSKIELAYPTQTSFTAAPDGTHIMPYPPEPAADPSQTRLPGPSTA
ncbi:MAG TPA: mechanosensitive ion channel family protein [Allosphingosinicella sp.]|jgi:small-conductance mechanosensitive channel